MNFGADHYVPVLKVKRGEKTALRYLLTSEQEHITPLMEIIKRKKEKTVAQHIDTSFDKLAESLEPFDRCFLDTREMAPDGHDAAHNIYNRAYEEGIGFTPVTGITRTADTHAALLNRYNGIAIRVTRKEFENGNLSKRITDFVTLHGLNPEETDLIVDLGAVNELVVAGIVGLTNSFLNDIPYHTRWRTFTISACAFPMSMSCVDRYSYIQVARAEWLSWKENLYNKRTSLKRLPTFSDCAIQHPTGVEDFDFRIHQVSASIRYTVRDDWLLAKGESTKKVPARIQFPQLAFQLVYGHLNIFFAGENHCSGCASIKNAADMEPGHGSPEVWRRFGTIHHLTSVTHDIGSLPFP